MFNTVCPALRQGNARLVLAIVYRLSSLLRARACHGRVELHIRADPLVAVFIIRNRAVNVGGSRQQVGQAHLVRKTAGVDSRAGVAFNQRGRIGVRPDPVFQLCAGGFAGHPGDNGPVVCALPYPQHGYRRGSRIYGCGDCRCGARLDPAELEGQDEEDCHAHHQHHQRREQHGIGISHDLFEPADQAVQYARRGSAAPMHRVRFIIAVLAIPGLVVLVRGLLGLWLVPLLRIRRVLWRVLWRILTLVLVPGRRVLLWLLWLILWLNGWGAGMREHGMAGMAVLAVGGVARMT